MPGHELLGAEELALLTELFDRGAVLLRHGFEARRNGLHLVGTFEMEFAERVGSPGALAVSSATAGLTIALRAVGVGPGDEVITQAFTYIATVEAIIAVGARPVIVEVDETLNMDPTRLLAAITERTRAVIPVHMLGAPADMPAILAVTDAAGIPVIEDAAEALGARLAGREVGTFGLAGVYSFDYNKTITAGEGGMIVSADPDFLARALHYHDHGHLNDPSVPRGEDGWSGVGFNFRLSELAGAVGLAQLRKLDDIVSANHRNLGLLRKLLPPELLELARPVVPGGEPLDDCLILTFPTAGSAGAVAAGLAAQGIDTKNLPSAVRWHFARHWIHLVDQFDLTEQELLAATELSERHLGRSVALPINVKHTEDRLASIAAALQRSWAAVEVGV